MKGRERASGRERDREGTREWGFMCSLVNERQALKVTGCVYYWSVSRLMGRGEEKREERAELLSGDQSTQAWEQEGAPSNKLCHTRCACPFRFTDNTPAYWIAFIGNENNYILLYCYESCIFQWTNIKQGRTYCNLFLTYYTFLSPKWHILHPPACKHFIICPCLQGSAKSMTGLFLLYLHVKAAC